jgi:hypothetical protein
MDKLKLKLQEYYQHCQQKDTRAKAGRSKGGVTVPEMENDILLQFGLPASKRFVQILHDFVGNRQMNEHLLDNVSKKLRAAARNYLLAPVVSDIDQLQQGCEQKRSPYDLLPELGYPVNDYTNFLVGELLYKRHIPAADILDELKRAQQAEAWDDILLLDKIPAYTNHDIYQQLKAEDLHFIDDFVQFNTRQAKTKAGKKLEPVAEGYTPNFKMVGKLQVEEIIFDVQGMPSLIGKLKPGPKQPHVTISLGLSTLQQVLAGEGELGANISNFIKKRTEKAGAIDLRVAFGQALTLENSYLEVYKPQHKHGQKWVEDKAHFYHVEKVLTKKEFEKKSKEEDTKQKIQECLELIGGSYGVYQRMRRLGITDEEAKLRAGLQDELLFKLSTYLHKLKA